jgi:Mg/Co/Ni transporter MgtE
VTQPSALSVAFIEKSPDSAAQILENLPAANAAALIEVLPTEVAALALGEMSALSGANSLMLLAPDRAGEILRAMQFQDAASVLRMMVLGVLPATLTRDFRKSLSHPRDSVGAWMDQRNSPLAQTRTVADALKYAKRKNRPAGDEVFVVDSARRYVGMVRISELVQNDGDAVLKDVVRPGVPTLSDRATLASVVNSADWDGNFQLPVIGRKGNFLGTVTRAQVRAGLASVRRRPMKLAANSVLAHLLTSYFVAFTGLIGLVLHAADEKADAGEEEAA